MHELQALGGQRIHGTSAAPRFCIMRCDCVAYHSNFGRLQGPLDRYDRDRVHKDHADDVQYLLFSLHSSGWGTSYALAAYCEDMDGILEPSTS
jgi:hypothetical protein